MPLWLTLLAKIIGKELTGVVYKSKTAVSGNKLYDGS